MSIVKALDSAAAALGRIGLLLKTEADAPVVAAISQIADIAPDDATAIARVLQQASAFNAMVRSEIGEMTIANRYEAIASDFNSIRDDASNMVGYVDDGRVDWKEKAALTWMRVTQPITIVVVVAPVLRWCGVSTRTPDTTEYYLLTTG